MVLSTAPECPSPHPNQDVALSAENPVEFLGDQLSEGYAKG